MNSINNIEKPLVFIVEDNAAYRVLLGRVLENLGFMIMMFEHGRKAADMMGAIKPSFIISDIQMPQMDGFEFLDFVNKNYGTLNIPFVYLSSSSNELDVKKGLALGARAILKKPVSPQKLSSALDNIINEVKLAG